MKRQVLKISIFDLLRMAKELEDEAKQFKYEMGLKLDEEDYNRKWQINIINKTPECSDTWEIEF